MNSQVERGHRALEPQRSTEPTATIGIAACRSGRRYPNDASTMPGVSTYQAERGHDDLNIRVPMPSAVRTDPVVYAKAGVTNVSQASVSRPTNTATAITA